MEGFYECWVERWTPLGAVRIFKTELLCPTKDVLQHPPRGHRPLIVSHAGVDLRTQKVHFPHLKGYLEHETACEDVGGGEKFRYVYKDRTNADINVLSNMQKKVMEKSMWL